MIANAAPGRPPAVAEAEPSRARSQWERDCESRPEANAVARDARFEGVLSASVPHVVVLRGGMGKKHMTFTLDR
jgi:hypothetical protein